MSQTVTQSEGTAEQMEVQAVPQVEILTVPKQTIADLFAEHYKLLKQFAPDKAKEMEANPELAQYIPKVQPTPEPPAPVRKLDRVAIVGFASHWNKAPFADKDTEVWSLNEFYGVAPEQLKAPLAEGRARWFEIHRREQNYEGNPFFLHSRESEHAAKLTALGCPVYMHRHWDDIPLSITYPKDDMMQHFHGYFTNSISWMIALAIAEGFKEIGIYGVDMAQDSEYCVAPETRVLTADLRWIPASEVQVGQKLVGFEEYPRTQTEKEGVYRQWQSAVVEDAVRLTRPCYRLHMADGTTLVCSAEHRWLVHRCNVHAWQETQRLQSADIYPQRSSKIVKLLNTWDEDKSWGAGYLAATLDGEGHLSQNPHQHCAAGTLSLGFAQRENGMSRAAERELQKRGFAFSRNDNGSVLQYNLKGGRSELLRFLGQIRPERLLDKFNPDAIGTTQSMANVPILKMEFLGEQPVIGLKTSTGTFVAEGFASHNSSQRPSCEYLIGWARALGIRITMPEECDLCSAAYLYGWDSHHIDAFHAKANARLQELRQRRAHNENVMQQARDAANQLLGAEENTRYLLAAHGGIKAGKKV